MKLKKKSEDAVSPVVGIMLMVVITVVIAAVITVFSSGLLADGGTSDPVMLLEVGNIEVEIDSATSSYVVSSVEFIHKGGDSIPLNDVEFSFVASRSGAVTNHYSAADPEDDVVVLGKASSPDTIVVVEPGDVIKVMLPYHIFDHKYSSPSKVTWTLYNTRTDATLSTGVFVVPEKI